MVMTFPIPRTGTRIPAVLLRIPRTGNRIPALLLLAALLGSAPSPRQSGSGALFEQPFEAPGAGEAVAVVHASAAGSDWGAAGREAAAVRILIDGKYSQHLLLARGADDSEYPITLGAVTKGSHRFSVEADAALSAPGAGRPTISRVEITVTPVHDEASFAQSLAPIVYARPNTVGHFTDLPILMWYEVVPTPRGKQFRYSVIFTNEDGGTATDRLMATWGRTTDIEYVYGAEVNAEGRIIAEEFQGPGHEVPGFHGRHEAGHPLMWVSTDNNMVSESGPTSIRYAPAPERFNLTNASREVVMDRHPWAYTLAAEEMAREGKIDERAAAGSGRIPDARRFVSVEACTELSSAAVAFSLRAAGADGPRWFDSDRGRPEFRIVRTGCFRGAVPLPAGAGRPDAIRFRAYALPAREGSPPPPAGSVRLVRVNKVFTVNDRYQPDASLFSWTGDVSLPIGGDWHELRFQP
jgi:hypothetical protein